MANKGYNNKDATIVNVSAKEKRHVRKLRRLAEKRELHGEHVRDMAQRATRRGWYYA